MSLRKLFVDVGYKISSSPLEALDKRLTKLSGASTRTFDKMNESMGKAGTSMKAVAERSGALSSTVSKVQHATDQATKATERANKANALAAKSVDRAAAAHERATKAAERAKTAIEKATAVTKSSTSSDEAKARALQRVQAATEKAISSATKAQQADERAKRATIAAAEASRNAIHSSEGVTRALDRQQKAAQRASREMDGLRQKYGDFSNGSLKVMNKIDQASGDIQVAGGFLLAGGAGLAAGLGSAIQTATDFEYAMSRVGAVSGASETQMEALTKRAKELGASTVFTSSQAAEGMQYLAMAGFKSNEIIEAMPGVLDAAAAGQIGLGDAANITSNIMSGFGLSATESQRAADVLTKAFTTSNTTLLGIGETMKYVAPAAHAVGWSLEDMAAASGYLGNVGLDASMAGTALRASVTRLAGPTTQAADLMKYYGINLEDANGKMRRLPDILGQMKSSFTNLSDAERASAVQTIFGTEAMSAMLALMDDPKGLDTYSQKLKDSAGTAAEIAARQMNNLKGATEKMKSAVEGAQLSIGEAFVPTLTWLSSKITSVVDKFNGLSDGTKKTIAIILAITAAATLLGGAFLIFISLLPSMIAGFSAISGVASIVAGIASPILGVIAAIVGIGAAVYFAYQKFEPFRNMIDSAIRTVKEFAVGIFGEIQSFFTENSTLFAEAAQGISTFLTDTFTALQPVLTVIWKVALFVIKGVWDNIKGVIQGAVGIILNTIKIFSALFSGNWAALWDGVKGFVSSALQFVWNLINLTFLGRLLGPIRTGFGLIKGIVSSGWAAVKSFFVSGVNGAKSLVSNMVSALTGNFTNLWNSVKTIVTGIKDSIVNGWRAAVDFLKSIDLFEIGKNVVQGFVNGIKSMVGDIKESIAGIATSAVDQFKSVLDIHSPSRVFMELGGFTGEGYGIGIQNSLPDVSRAISSLAGETVGGMAQMPNTAQAVQSSMYNHHTTNNTSGPAKVEININVQGNADSSVVQDMKQEVKKAIDEAFKSFGRRNPKYVEV
ncbi:phage tail tape measure protein [Brevibacillus laterosporus]|nr:phage tail tape measure protein [Brevibacillus laterosporus]TPG89950.1 phage tail tape measure protein [Brevibacillus laterosporus]